MRLRSSSGANGPAGAMPPAATSRIPLVGGQLLEDRSPAGDPAFDGAVAIDTVEPIAVDSLVVAAHLPDDPVTRAARALRGVLGNTHDSQGDPIRRVALLDLDADAEMAILAANLGVVCAQSGLRTLLVDAGLVEPTMATLFRLDDPIRAVDAPDDGMRIRPTAIEGLLALVNDRIGAPDHGALIEAIDRVDEDVDLILMPVGDAHNDVEDVMKHFDGAMLVVRRNLSEMRIVRETVDRLNASGVAVLGTVLVD